MANLKQSTAYTRTFMMIASADHIAGLTGATPVVKLSKAGGAGAAAGGTVTEVDSTNCPGLYKIALTTTDTGTLGDLAFCCTAASGDPTNFIDQVTANILGDTLPASVAGSVGSVTGNVGGSVASVTAGVTVSTNNDKTGYALTSGERTSIADALLDRDMSVGTDSGSASVRTTRQALRTLRNKVDLSSGTSVTVYKEDDASVSWAGAVTTNAGAIPIVTVDPAGP
jgi:hypothetical protein